MALPPDPPFAPPDPPDASPDPLPPPTDPVAAPPELLELVDAPEPPDEGAPAVPFEAPALELEPPGLLVLVVSSTPQLPSAIAPQIKNPYPLDRTKLRMTHLFILCGD